MGECSTTMEAVHAQREPRRPYSTKASAAYPPHMNRVGGVIRLVLDFSNAFWTVPLDLKERKFFVGRVRGWHLVYNTTAQGSRNAPLSWCTLIAMVARLTQGLFCPLREARMQVYVDDPALAVCGNAKARNRIICLTMTIWTICGFKLAFGKGQRGQQVQWIGGDITIAAGLVTVSIPDEKCQELLSLTNDIQSGNVVACKKLRTYSGKANSIASLVDVMRPPS